ncbi:hypothetical protein TWF102_010859 [Orbilia oligospora]|uniref:Uncharacterized protein n=2 Tax=Orbilia oligospora TaxID=2813651 RepID=A0A7C8N777_ORBOL|nr:hypothetical protein TWF103_002996 [Orbilia oligospora]KAF3086912.1 hypothetical protein TWF102_010859 [Orbilia oligospora]
MFGRHMIKSFRQTSISRGMLNLSISTSMVPNSCHFHRFNTSLAIRPTPLKFPSTVTFNFRGYSVSNSRSLEQSDPRYKVLKSDPSKVTTSSSIRPIIETSQAPHHGGQQDILKGGFQHDLNVIRETFAFREVPKEVLFFGGAGLVPYIATTASTFFLAWDIKNISQEGAGYIVNQETASTILSLLEPIQVGFGAVILSFLGAIHWGLEFAAYGGNHPYQRYLLGILAPALAWPTVFMQYDIALLTQFLGFTGMYFADSRATKLGLAPKWYTTYRFLLTFVVGACIVMTLIGRSKIDEKGSASDAPQERVHRLRQGEGLETTSVQYRQLVQQDQQEIEEKVRLEKEEAEQRLTEKKTEYLEAKEGAKRAALKTVG